MNRSKWLRGRWIFFLFLFQKNCLWIFPSNINCISNPSDKDCHNLIHVKIQNSTFIFFQFAPKLLEFQMYFSPTTMKYVFRIVLAPLLNFKNIQVFLSSFWLRLIYVNLPNSKLHSVRIWWFVGLLSLCRRSEWATPSEMPKCSFQKLSILWAYEHKRISMNLLDKYSLWIIKPCLFGFYFFNFLCFLLIFGRTLEFHTDCSCETICFNQCFSHYNRFKSTKISFGRVCFARIGIGVLWIQILFNNYDPFQRLSSVSHDLRFSSRLFQWMKKCLLRTGSSFGWWFNNTVSAKQ